MVLEKKLVNHHAGNILVESEKTKEFLCNIYNDTHPVKTSRGKLNFIGGGKNETDISPIYTVIREIYEEFSLSRNTDLDPATIQDAGGKYSLPKIGEMASLEDINEVKENILKYIVPHQDFLITLKPLKGGPKMQNPNAVFSIFYSKIPQEVFEIARKNLRENKSLVNDGFLKIVTEQEILGGNPLTSWASGGVFENHFNKKVPNPNKIKFKMIGKPLDAYKKYLEKFDYIRF